MSKTRFIEIPLTMDSFEAADRFIEQCLAQNRLSKDAIMEAKLLLEALFRDIIEQGFDQDTDTGQAITVSAQPAMLFGNDKRAKTNAINIIEALAMTCKEEYKAVLKNNKG